MGGGANACTFNTTHPTDMNFRLCCIPILLLPVLSTAATPVDTARLIAQIDTQLTRGNQWVSGVLTDTTLFFLHPLPAFREVIRQHARAEKIALAARSEPGVPTHVEGNVLDSDGEPLANALVYLYQTDARGWYADTAVHISGQEGDRRHARLFGYVRTDANGFFAVETIRPQSYPGSALPQHIHCEVFAADGRVLITELLFKDDPMLTPEVSFWALNNHFTIAPNIGTAKRPYFSYQLALR